MDEYVGHINVLATIAKSGESAPEIGSVPNPAEAVRLKDHVARALEKGEDDKKVAG